MATQTGYSEALSRARSVLADFYWRERRREGGLNRSHFMMLTNGVMMMARKSEPLIGYASMLFPYRRTEEQADHMAAMLERRQYRNTYK